MCSRSYIRSLFDTPGTPSSLLQSPETNKERLQSIACSNGDANNNDPIQSDLESVQNRSKSTEVKEETDGLTITSCCPTNGLGESQVSIKGRFLAINAATMSCRCGHSKYGISPAQHLGNGCCDLIVVSQCTRKDYLKYLLRTGFSEKSAVSVIVNNFFV